MCSRMESVGEVASGDDAHPMTGGTARKAGGRMVASLYRGVTGTC